MKNRHAAFTLIELVIAIVIIAIVAVVVTTKWPSQIINVNAQADALLSDIRYAQHLAMTRGVRYYFLKVSNNTYRIADVSGGNVINYTLGPQITFGAFTNLPNNLIAFDERGVPYVDLSTPGTPLTATASIVLLGSDGSTKTITISPETGWTSQ